MCTESIYIRAHTRIIVLRRLLPLRITGTRGNFGSRGRLRAISQGIQRLFVYLANVVRGRRYLDLDLLVFILHHSTEINFICRVLFRPPRNLEVCSVRIGSPKK